MYYWVSVIEEEMKDRMTEAHKNKRSYEGITIQLQSNTLTPIWMIWVYIQIKTKRSGQAKTNTKTNKAVELSEQKTKQRKRQWKTKEEDTRIPPKIPTSLIDLH